MCRRPSSRPAPVSVGAAPTSDTGRWVVNPLPAPDRPVTMAAMWTLWARAGSRTGRSVALAGMAVCTLAVGTAAVPPAAYGGPANVAAGHCARQDRVVVPGAAYRTAACLPDLTTRALTGTPYTNPADW